ncbi:MAG TPA: hypothetical protein VIW64_14475 [Pyrinomonadaceae bacterium]|jgi:hypothetical protein
MKRWKKLLLVLLLLVLLSQVPFAYRRYKLGRLHAAIQQVNSQRNLIPDDGSIVEYKGVAHVHSFLGGHSSGNFEEIIAAAHANALDFVVMTEHPSNNFDTAAMTLKGEHGGVLFINGNEVRTANGDRLLLLPGDSQAANDALRSTPDVFSRRPSELEFVAYPDQFKSWEASGYEGIEVYNVYTNARSINPLVMFFDALWSYRTYTDLLFANFYRKPVESLKKWDELIAQKGARLVATAGNDSHSNIGLSLNDASGKAWLGIKLDPYERSFRLVRLHVLSKDFSSPGGQGNARQFNDGAVLSDISRGHCFIGFDLFGDTTGFRFTAQSADENKILGDEIKLAGQVKLKISVPVQARIVLLKDGVAIQEAAETNRLEFVAREQGSYRVEVYLPQLPGPVGQQPWIISNPIYVR